jgi:hypothetical protein
MKKQWFKMAVLVVGFVMVLGFLGLALLDSPDAAADDVTELWLSPEEPPPGLSVAALSPPDIPDFDPHRPDESSELLSNIVSQRITGNVLRPSSSITGFAPSGGCIYATSNAQINFNTPLYLPQGAEIRQVRMYFYDASSEYNSLGWLLVHDLYGTLVYFWQVTSTGNFGHSFNDTAIIGHTVDYNLFSYSLIWRPVITGDSMRLCGFRIFYEPPPFGIQFLPYVERP